VKKDKFDYENNHFIDYKNEKMKNLKKRKLIDLITDSFSYLFSGFGVCILIMIIGSVFSNGVSTLSWEYITSDYHTDTITCSLPETINEEETFDNPMLENSFFAEKWGISFVDSFDINNEKIVLINYIDIESPINNLVNSNTEEYVGSVYDKSVDSIILTKFEGGVISISASDGAEVVADKFDQGSSIITLSLISIGGGCRGSIISTLYMIGLTLLFALPLGIGCAIYLNEYAKDNILKRIMKNLIIATSGIPSIIFGLAGAIIFIPIVNSVSGSNGGSIISGALTLSAMLLPVIVSNTEEAMKAIPSSYKSASLALGASQSQTTFKVILPSSISGILTGTLLSVGRIIGESAALIYATGASIQDTILLNGSSTTLAVHIWSLMNGENPNYASACAVAIIIIVIDLSINIMVKIFGNSLNNKFKGVKLNEC
jgi:phosphate transport system permease protein